VQCGRSGDVFGGGRFARLEGDVGAENEQMMSFEGRYPFILQLGAPTGWRINAGSEVWSDGNARV
jgi:hypothetical protein